MQVVKQFRMSWYGDAEDELQKLYRNDYYSMFEL